jgi:hypothetical protein
MLRPLIHEPFEYTSVGFGLEAPSSIIQKRISYTSNRHQSSYFWVLNAIAKVTKLPSKK